MSDDVLSDGTPRVMYADVATQDWPGSFLLTEARLIERDAEGTSQAIGEPLAEYIDRRLDEMETRLMNAIRGMP